jgi:hypothetical protein
MSPKIEIDIKVTKRVRTEQTVERRREDIRHPHWRHKDATPWYRNLSGCKAAQFDLMTCQIAGNPAKVPLKFDGWPLRPDPLGDIGGQNRSFGPGIQD